MKVKLNFKVDQVFAINALLGAVYEQNFNAHKTEEKLILSIGSKLSDSFEKRKRKLYKDQDLISQNKEVSITFMYYEAWALHKLLVNHIGLLKTDYQKINAQKSIALIDPEIC